MIQFRLLTGRQAGALWAARRFPVRVGRSASADLQSTEEGVWDQHCQVEFQPGEGFVLVNQPNALTALNGQPVQRARLRNGDVLALGALRLQFWLGQTRQSGLSWREWATWAGIAAVSLLQVALVYWLRA